MLILRIFDPFHQPDMPYLVRKILGGRRPNEHICSVRDTEHNTLLHRAMQCLGEIFSEDISYSLTDKPEIVNEMPSLIADFVKGGSDLHALTLKGQTPMLTLLSSCGGARGLIHNKSSKYTPIESPPAPLRIWLEQLKYSGIDLRRYGRKEKSLWKDPRMNRDGNIHGHAPIRIASTRTTFVCVRTRKSASQSETVHVFLRQIDSIALQIFADVAQDISQLHRDAKIDGMRESPSRSAGSSKPITHDIINPTTEATR